VIRPGSSHPILVCTALLVSALREDEQNFQRETMKTMQPTTTRTDDSVVTIGLGKHPQLRSGCSVQGAGGLRFVAQSFVTNNNDDRIDDNLYHAAD
jgi:hypothetical protein